MADDKTEYQINDRLSFQRFLGLSLGSNWSFPKYGIIFNLIN
jgi:hypothetical protein